MNVLAIDTSGSRLNLAVARDYSILYALGLEAGTKQAELIPAQAGAVIDQAGIALDQLDGIAVTTGPGSFTGLRVGLSFAKGFSLALNKPLLGLNTLDAMAWSLPRIKGTFSPMLDARKGRVYAALYRIDNGVIERVSGYCEADPAAWAAGLPQGAVVTGSGAISYRSALQEMAGLSLTDPPLAGPSAEGLINLAQHLASRDAWTDCDEIDACYLRPPDAKPKSHA
jgi:tRNA threonylcarbamoyladenosine biosynthesis protein TsaB